MGSIKTEHLPQYKIEDYQRWEGDWELIRGIPYSMSPSANKTHQDIARNILQKLLEAMQSEGCACKLYYELDLILGDDTVVRPDLMIFCDEFEGDYPSVVPDMVVEIISKSSRHQDETVKFELYQECGIKIYLLIDSERKSITLFNLDQGKYTESNLMRQIQVRDCMMHLDLEGIFD